MRKNKLNNVLVYLKKRKDIKLIGDNSKEEKAKATYTHCSIHSYRERGSYSRFIVGSKMRAKRKLKQLVKLLKSGKVKMIKRKRN